MRKLEFLTNAVCLACISTLFAHAYPLGSAPFHKRDIDTRALSGYPEGVSRWLVTVKHSESSDWTSSTNARKLAQKGVSVTRVLEQILGSKASARSLADLNTASDGDAATRVNPDGSFSGNSDATSPWHMIHAFSMDGMTDTAVVELDEDAARRLQASGVVDVRQDNIGWVHSLNAPIPVAKATAPADSIVNSLAASTPGLPEQTSIPTTNWGLDRLDQQVLKNYLPLDGRYAYVLNGSGVDVFVFDTGLRMDHVEYAGRIVDGINFWADQPSNDYSDDCIGHGAAAASQALGSTVGVANGASLFMARISGCYGYFYMSDVLRSTEWVVRKVQERRRPAVINLSGSTMTFDYIFGRIRSSLDSLGIPFIASAGNEYGDACALQGIVTYYPNSSVSPAHLLVGATALSYYWPTYTRAYDSAAFFSNSGSCAEVWAPGYQVLCASYKCTDCYSFWSGTSFSAPLVAGIAALIRQAYPDWSPDDVKSAIINGGTRNVIRFPSLSTAQASISHNVLAYAPAKGAADIFTAGNIANPACPTGFNGPYNGFCYKGLRQYTSAAGAASACAAAAPGATLAAARNADQAINVISDFCGGGLLTSKRYWIGYSDAASPSQGRRACCWYWAGSDADPYYMRTSGGSWWSPDEPKQFTYDCTTGEPSNACAYVPRNAHCVVVQGGKMFAVPCDGAEQMQDACCEVPATADAPARSTSGSGSTASVGAELGSMPVAAAVCDKAYRNPDGRESWVCQLADEGDSAPTTSSAAIVSGNDVFSANAATGTGGTSFLSLTAALADPWVRFTIAFNATATVGALSNSVAAMGTLRSFVATYFGQPATSVTINRLSDPATNTVIQLDRDTGVNSADAVETGSLAFKPASDEFFARQFNVIASARRVLQAGATTDVPLGTSPALRTPVTTDPTTRVYYAQMTIYANSTLPINVNRSTETSIALALRQSSTPVAMLSMWADMWQQEFGTVWASFAIAPTDIFFHTYSSPYGQVVSTDPASSDKFGLALGLSVGFGGAALIAAIALSVYFHRKQRADATASP